MTENENKLIQIAIEKINSVDKKLDNLDGKIDKQSERLIEVELKQKFIEGTVKQYKEDTNKMIDQTNLKIKDDFNIVHEKIRDNQNLIDEKIKNSISSIKVWVLIAAISALSSVIGLLISFLIK